MVEMPSSRKPHRLDVKRLGRLSKDPFPWFKVDFLRLGFVKKQDGLFIFTTFGNTQLTAKPRKRLVRNLRPLGRDSAASLSNADRELSICVKKHSTSEQGVTDSCLYKPQR